MTRYNSFVRKCAVPPQFTITTFAAHRTDIGRVTQSMGSSTLVKGLSTSRMTRASSDRRLLTTTSRCRLGRSQMMIG
jgi:hypothetical protein